ncbi:MAG: ACP S-malonyltransferase [Treponema sp.]|jgi:[acyl-carrier-protein] S-malonyltransferase|nr:ACP S-malonyltransferase [Treponema sp.]
MFTRPFVWLFPGQGAQYQGMALDFWEQAQEVRQLFELASDSTGQDMYALLLNGDRETLKRSDISQPAITLANLSAAAYLAKQGFQAAGVAGFSLGEYAALVIAGVISAENCFRLVRARGKAMQESADRLGRGATAPGMAAVIGLTPEQVASLIAVWKAQGVSGLYAANINSPRQTVVAGTSEALAMAISRFKDAGAKRVIPLAVAGPFHSPLIADAAERFRPVLESVAFMDPLIPCYSNVSGTVLSTGAEAKQRALEQITKPVRWLDEERAIAAQTGIAGVLETGPGQVLTGLWKEAGNPLPCMSAGTVAAIEEVLRTLTCV